MPRVNNYKVGAIKRKMKVRDTAPGELIAKMNAMKVLPRAKMVDTKVANYNKQLASIAKLPAKKQVGVKGLI